MVLRLAGTLRKIARYEEIEYLELKTEDEVIALLKPNVTRWTLIDADDLNDSDGV